MALRTNALSLHAPGGVPAGTLRFEPTVPELDALRPWLVGGSGVRLVRKGATEHGPMPVRSAADPGGSGPAATLLRRSVFLSPPPVRPFFAVCAVEAWRRIPVDKVAGWSGIPLPLLKRRLAASGLTPAGVMAWNLALHAAWLLDVAELPPSLVVQFMRLGRSTALAAVLGGRGVCFLAGKVEPGAFQTTLNRYLRVLRGAFGV